MLDSQFYSINYPSVCSCCGIIPVTDFSFPANRTSQYFKHDWILLVSLAVFLVFLWMSPKYLHTHLIDTKWTVSTLLPSLSVIWVMIACLSSLASFSCSVLASAETTKPAASSCRITLDSTGAEPLLSWACWSNPVAISSWFCRVYRDLLLGEAK